MPAALPSLDLSRAGRLDFHPPAHDRFPCLGLAYRALRAGGSVPVVLNAIVQNAGQTCTAGSRLLVQRSIYDRFVGQVAEAFNKVRVGSPEMDLDCGPVMNPAQFARVNRYIQQARDGGVPVLAELARAMGVKLIIHGHHHVNYRATAEDGLQAMGVGAAWGVAVHGTPHWQGDKLRLLGNPQAGWSVAA